MAERERITLSVLLLVEGESWVAQCLEYDIVAQGKTPRKALESFGWVIGAQVLLDKQRRRKPLSTFERAPERFWEKFKDGIPLRDPFPLTLPVVSFDLPDVIKEVRLQS
jgi:hypothetical protein